MITFKPAQSTDLNSIRRLMRASKTYWAYDEKFLNKFMEIIGIRLDYMQKHDIQLAYLNKAMIGFYNFILHNDGVLELDNLFLHPDYIGKGFGRILWQYICETAKQLGKNEFTIWSDPYAELFYLKMGCEKIGVRKSPMMPNRYPPVLRYQLKI